MHSPVPAGQALLATELLLVLQSLSNGVRIVSEVGGKKRGKKISRKIVTGCFLFPSQMDVPPSD